MARYCGQIGYRETLETEPGVWKPTITERIYKGDTTRLSRRFQSVSKINSDVSLNVSISVIADAYAYENFMNIAYVWWGGKRWAVSNIEVQRPRLILDLGGLYES